MDPVKTSERYDATLSLAKQGMKVGKTLFRIPVFCIYMCVCSVMASCQWLIVHLISFINWGIKVSIVVFAFNNSSAQHIVCPSDRI